MSKPKIKVISRNPEDYLRATKRDIHKCKEIRKFLFALHSLTPNVFLWGITSYFSSLYDNNYIPVHV